MNTETRDAYMKIIDERNERIDALKEECWRIERTKDSEIDALRTAANGMIDQIKNQSDHIDRLMSVNVELTTQIREQRETIAKMGHGE